MKYYVTFLLGVLFGAFVVSLDNPDANQKKQVKTLAELRLKNEIAAMKNIADTKYWIGELIRANNKTFDILRKQQKQIDSLKRRR